MFDRHLLSSVGLTALLLTAAFSFAQLQPVPLPGGGRVLQPAQQSKPEPVDQAAADRKALEAAGLKADDPGGLLDYIRQRTLSDADLSKIQAVIRRLGADDFEERLKAAVEVERFGPAAVAPLRNAAQNDPDYEIAYRAGESLRRLEKVPHESVAAAVARALGKLKPADTAKVLLAFLPLADSPAVADEIRTTLKAVAVRDGKAEPALVAALKDPTPERRAAAAVALIEGGSPGERVRIPDAYPRVLEAVRAESDVETRFQILYSLLTTAREKTAVVQIIDLLPELPRGRLWQAEDYLLQLAGEAAPKATLGKSRESLTAARDSWKGWWARAEAVTDLEKYDYTPRVTGKTLLILMDNRGYSSGSVIELGPDLKERWKIVGLMYPMDAQYLPDGTLAIAEHNNNRVTIRDTTGRILSTRMIGGQNRVSGTPQQLQVLDNGNLLIICRNQVVEYKTGKEEPERLYVRNNHDISAAQRLPDGHTLLLLQSPPNHVLFLDDKGKEVADRTLKTGIPPYQGHITATGSDRVLVTEMNRVVEYDLKKNEAVWEKAINQPRSVQRLPNGNTLVAVAVPPPGRLVEFTPDGEEVWSYQPTSGLQVFRGYRR
jgi:hypothetical protein